MTSGIYVKTRHGNEDGGAARENYNIVLLLAEEMSTGRKLNKLVAVLPLVNMEESIHDGIYTCRSVRRMGRNEYGKEIHGKEVTGREINTERDIYLGKRCIHAMEVLVHTY